MKSSPLLVGLFLGSSLYADTTLTYTVLLYRSSFTVADLTTFGGYGRIQSDQPSRRTWIDYGDTLKYMRLQVTTMTTTEAIWLKALEGTGKGYISGILKITTTKDCPDGGNKVSAEYQELKAMPTDFYTPTFTPR